MVSPKQQQQPEEEEEDQGPPPSEPWFAAGLPLPGGTSERLWHDAAGEVQLSLHHPFVSALAAGTLPRASFQAYILQDAFFLSHFARAYAAALDKLDAVTPASAGAARAGRAAATRRVLSRLLLGVHAELQLHGAYAARWGVDMHGPVVPAAATAAYCDFLLGVAHDPRTSVAEVLAAMLPCSRLYGFLGCSLAPAVAHLARHAYSEWLDTYSGAEYLAWPLMKERLFDDLLRHDCAVPYERLRQLYTRAMQLEADFFSGQPGAPPPRRVGLLVVDFDETATERDTVSVLLNAAVAARTAGAGAPAGQQQQQLRQSLTAQVQSLAANYAAEQQQLLVTILPQQASPAAQTAGGAAQRYDAAGLQRFSEALSSFDVDMNQVVIDAGILQGLTAADVSAAGATVQLRAGFADTLAAAAAAGVPVELLSVNWSTTLIEAALGQQQQAQQQQRPGIHANELVWDSDGRSTGVLERRVQNGRDKAGVMRALLQRHRASSSDDTAAAAAAAAAVVYVGDSASDILPLLQADYGLVIGHNQLLRRALAAFGVQLRPLCAASLAPPGSGSAGAAEGPAAAAAAADAPVLYEASSWHEIRAFLFGPASGGPGAASAAAAGDVLVRVSGDRAAALAPPPDGAAAAAVAAAAAAGAATAPPRVVLTIAGSDSGGGAGIQADLKAILANGGFGASVLTALTAQNTRGVQAVHVVPPSFVAAQLDSVLGDLQPAAIKTGMLPDAAAVEAVAAKLRQHYGAGSGSSSGSGRLPPLVVDPVMVSTSGHSLAGGGVGGAIKAHLLPLAAMVTPNLAEAEALWGSGQAISCLADMEAAARHLHSFGCASVLVKGGHLAERQQQAQQPQQAQEVVDVLFDGSRFHYFTGPHVATPNTHGTGCTLAAAIAAHLAAGASPVQAVAAAKGYLTCVLAASRGLLLGAGPQRPFHHGAGFARQPAAGSAAAAAAADGSAAGGLRPLNPVDLRMYVVTDAGCNARAGRSLMQAVAGAVAGGATVVQLREKDIDGGDFLREARAIVEYCRPRGVPVIINDRVDVALAAGADGVHVGQSDLPARVVRRMIGPRAILGVSVKTPPEAAKAAADGADYLGVGAVFPTGTKDSSVIGLDGLAAVVDVAGRLPCVAIGGVGAHNAAPTLAAGVRGLAVVSAVFAAPDVEAATRELRAAVDGALAEQQAAAPAAEEEEQLAAAVQ